ncbi:MAG TPA: protein YgfX [Azonexus sp.]|nr:protein YgfX [Azonexus sp.]
MVIGLHRSRFLRVALVAVAALAGVATLALPWAPDVRVVNFAAIVIVAGLAWRRLGLGISAIKLEQDGQISLAATGDSEFIEADLLAGATVHPWLTVIRLKTADQRQHLLIVAVDSMKAEDFRRLRVFLRWRAAFSVPVGDA